MKSILIAAVALAGAATTACAPVQEGQAPPAGGVEPTPVACKAGDYQEYVGRNRSTLPEAPAGRTFRVACSSCAVTMDYRFNRVTFTYDEKTDLITRVACG